MLIKIPVHNKPECAFWIRAFDLQAEIDQVVGMINQKAERKTAFAPVITEHQAGSIEWTIFLGLTIDQLGLQGGMGYVWLTTGPKHRDQALHERDKLANHILRSAGEAGRFDEIIEVESKRDV